MDYPRGQETAEMSRSIFHKQQNQSPAKDLNRRKEIRLVQRLLDMLHGLDIIWAAKNSLSFPGHLGDLVLTFPV